MGTTVRQMRLNPLNGRWVTIVAERADRPSDFAPRDRTRETDSVSGPARSARGTRTPPSRRSTSSSRTATWQMRVIPNLYPAFDGASGFVVHHLGPVHVTADASGVHEVFVYTPVHDSGLNDLSDAQRRPVMQALKRRLTEHAATAEHPLHAGDRQPRPRSRGIARPPARPDPRPAVRADARSSTRSGPSPASPADASSAPRSTPSRRPATASCSPTTTSCASPRSGAVRPFELMMMPRRHERHLQHADDASLDAMGVAVRDAVGHLTSALGDVAFNIGLHTAPHEHSGEYHWHVHLWPILVTAGRIRARHRRAHQRGRPRGRRREPALGAGQRLTGRRRWPRPASSSAWWWRCGRPSCGPISRTSPATSSGWPTPARSSSRPTSARGWGPGSCATPASARSASTTR